MLNKLIRGLWSIHGIHRSYDEDRMSPFDAFALEELVSSFGRNDLTCLEIGSWFGAGSTQIIGKFSEELVCVDHWQGNENEEHREIVATIDVFKRFVSNTSKFDGRVKPIRGSSQDVCPLLEKMKYDFIFIDGDHRYSSTIRELNPHFHFLNRVESWQDTIVKAGFHQRF